MLVSLGRQTGDCDKGEREKERGLLIELKSKECVEEDRSINLYLILYLLRRRVFICDQPSTTPF